VCNEKLFSNTRPLYPTPVLLFISTEVTVATEAEIERALLAAAASVAGRPLRSDEVRKLTDGYRTKSGGPYQRALRSIDEALNITEDERRQKIAASDDADRLMQDLQDLISSPKKP
jgi:hypothetical protein